MAPIIAAGLLIALACRARAERARARRRHGPGARHEHRARARAERALGFVLLAGAAVAAAGPIAFVGLAVPHIARGVVGPDYRWTIPYAIVLGAALLLASDVLGRVMARPAELGVGIVTALLGAPFFIWLVRRRKLMSL